MSLRVTLLVLITLVIGCKAQEEPFSLPEFIQGWTQEPRSTDQQIWDGLVGNWYGSLIGEDEARHQWLIRRFADGTYEIDFQVTSTEGRVRFSRETGQWGAAGGIYFSIFRGWLHGNEFEPSDPSDAFNYDAYRMLELYPDRLVYESLKTNTRYEVHRVPDAFQIPTADEEASI